MSSDLEATINCINLNSSVLNALSKFDEAMCETQMSSARGNRLLKAVVKAFPEGAPV